MNMKKMRRYGFTAVAVLALSLAGCASSDPLGEGDSSSAPAGGGATGSSIVVGSQAYYSNEIVAEIYAQALEDAGKKVERKFNRLFTDEGVAVDGGVGASVRG